MPFAGPDDGTFLILDETGLWQIDQTGQKTIVFTLDHTITSEAELLSDDTGNRYIYPGEGRSLFAYDPRGNLQWIAYMPGSHLHAPRLGIGSGRYLYALSTDGQLLAYDMVDGRLLEQFVLYNGGNDGSPTARWLSVRPDDIVRFGSGYLSIVTLDGLVLTDEADPANGGN